MNTLYHLTYRNLKLNKKRTFVTLIGIILSVALICAVAGMVSSFQQSLIDSTIASDGNYHMIFYDVPLKEANKIRKHREIEYSFSFGHIGYAHIYEDPEKVLDPTRPYIRLTGYDKAMINNYPLYLSSGRLAEKSNEIVITTALAEDYRFKIGDTLTLTVGTRVDSNGDILTEEDELVTDVSECKELDYCESIIVNKNYLDERIENATTKEYTIVGIAGRDSYSYQYMPPSYVVYTLLDSYEQVKSLNLYFRYKNPKHYREINKELNPEKIVNENGTIQYTYEYNENSYLLNLLGAGFGDSSMKALYTIMTIVITIIMVSSIFVIKNGFSISIVERYKQFGMLSSIGATSKQIRKSVLFEGFLLGIIAIPLGILCGVLADFILVYIVNYIIKDFVESDMMAFHITYLPILVAVITSAITIFLSCLIPALKASRQSILELIRGNQSIKMKHKKLKTPKYISALFGVGGEIADKNLKRSKKKYRATVVSLVVSIVIFISLYSFMNLVFDTSSYYFNQADYDFSIHYYTSNGNFTDSTRGDIEAKEKEFLSFGKTEEYATVKTIHLNNDDSSIWNKQYINYHSMNGIHFEGRVTVQAVGKEEYERLVKKIGGNVKDYEKGAILIDDFLYYDRTTKKYQDLNFLDGVKEGDIIKLKQYFDDESPENLKIKVLKRTTEKTLNMNSYMEVHEEPILIVSEDYFYELAKDCKYYGFSIYMKTDDTDHFEEGLEPLEEESHGHLYHENISQAIREQRALVLIVSIFLYGFIAVITLIGVTNIFNTITTNMALRSREFAMLKAIGMTKKEFNRMIRLESILYGLKALIIGIPIGIILSYFIHDALTNVLETSYKLPMNAIIISIIFVFVIVYMTMRYSLNKINKQNIIETIREENI